MTPVPLALAAALLAQTPSAAPAESVEVAAPIEDPNAAPPPPVEASAPPPVLTAPPPVLLGPPPPRTDPEDAVFTPVPLALRPAPPRRRGTGLIIGAAILGGVNIGLAATRFALNLGEYDERRDAANYYITTIATPISVVAGIGLASGGGWLRGRWDGHRSAYDGIPKLRAKTFIQSGGILLGMGIVGYVMAWIPWHGDSSLDGRGGGTLLIESVSSLVLIGGAGLLVYGASWQKTAEAHGYSGRIALRPALSRHYAGFSLVGRF